MTPLSFISDLRGISRKDKERENYIFTSILYMPNALIILMVFTISNIIIIPFAYLYHCKVLFVSIFNVECHDICRRVKLTLYFATAGLVLLILSVPVDTVVFMYNLFTEPKKDELKAKEGTKLFTREGISIFEDACDEVISKLKQKLAAKDGEPEELRHLKNQNGGYQMNFVEFNKLLAKKFRIIREITRLIYDTTDENKFVYNDFTKKS